MEDLTVLITLSVVILTAITHASLQLSLGSLLLLYHESLGKHIKKRTKFLVSNYIFGSFFLIITSLTTVCFFIYLLFNGGMSIICLVVLSIILVALTLCIWLFYYRKGKTTELWLPKPIAKYITQRAKQTNSNIEAFALGILTSFAETPFIIILILVSADNILRLPQSLQFVMIFTYTFLAILPLFCLRVAVKHGKTIVEIQKWRLKNRNFLRILSGVLFLALAIFLVAFRVF